MTNAIEVSEYSAQAKEVILPMAQAEGYMAWTTSTQPPHYWQQAYMNPTEMGNNDPYRCPYPLFPTREIAIAACARALPNGGICKIVKITL
jgi:hypothetical protein